MENLIPKYDKSNWGKGEWNDEPDRVDFIHAGFSCFILRNHLGNWCGYVGVPREHSCYEKNYNDVDVNAHGGLTYADKCSPPICHVPQEGMSDDVWWFGFDTAHYGDLTPSLNRYSSGHDTYKNMEYATQETKNLADQLKEL